MSVIVTISGRPGSGKSAVAQSVANALQIRHVSAGDFMREMAAERDLTILELSRSAENAEEIDREIDDRTVRLATESDDFVMDARLGWHFIPHSFKVFLEVRPEVAAERIYGAQRGAEHENISLEDTKRAIQSRTESEKARYMTYYDLDYADHSQYDLVIDTSEKTIDEVVAIVLDRIESHVTG
jgi:CMP/dCMP kinase